MHAAYQKKQQDGKRLLHTVDEVGYDSIGQVVHHGEQLEHFHSYQRGVEPLGTRTIELHTDQGLFIAFTPAMLLAADGLMRVDEESFVVRMSDGTESRVSFAADSLVFMIGDAVSRIINPHLSSSPPLRPTPHAVALSSRDTRLWYGRMFLPPPLAVSEQHGVTFARLREIAVQHSTKELRRRRGEAEDSVVDLGCSSNRYARRVGSSSCATNQVPKAKAGRLTTVATIALQSLGK